MKKRLCVCYFFIYIFYNKIICDNEASFYGSSFITFPLKEIQKQTKISFDFRTSLENSLLLLIAGDTDYCMICLEDGFLKITLNIGFNESEIFFSNSKKLNDLAWHQIFIFKNTSDLFSSIDNEFITRKKLTGHVFDLNINYGLFLGSIVDYSDLFFGHLNNFRGCMKNVDINNKSLLELAKNRQIYAKVNDISWGCVDEFDFSLEDEISFTENNSYILVKKNLIEHSAFRFQMEFKTILKFSMILYNSGLQIRNNFFVIEIWNRKLRLLIKLSKESIIEIESKKIISDGHWHKLDLKMNSLSLELAIDNEMNSMKLKQGKHFNFNDLFFIGGLNDFQKSIIFNEKLQIFDKHFQGCMKNIEFNENFIKPRGILMSSGITFGCLWSYPCLDRPCIDSAVCYQIDLDSFQCKCEQKLCIDLKYNRQYKLYSSTNLVTNFELLSIQPLNVLENGNALITTNHLNILFDYSKFGVNESGILFNIIKQPNFGTINIEKWPRVYFFSLFDLSIDKVHYINDGSEEINDYVILELKFQTIEPFILPVYLQNSYQFTLPIIIESINDKPILRISKAIFRLIQNSKKVITNFYLNSTDSDNEDEKLMYLIEYNDKIEHYGHFEKLSLPNERIKTFSQADINSRLIVFRDYGLNNNYSIGLQLTDSIEISPTLFLKIATFEPVFYVQNNTGLLLNYNSSSLITTYNISIVTNFEDSLIDIKFEIKKQPLFGVIELEDNSKNRQWTQVNYFSYKELKQLRVRYRHLTQKPDFDEFRFKLYIESINQSVLYTFHIDFTELKIYPSGSKMLIMNKTKEIFITEYELSHQIKPLQIDPSNIMYRITKLPIYGYLFYPISKYKMKLNDIFSLEDIQLYNVKYQLRALTYSNFIDEINYIVEIKNSNSHLIESLKIFYEPDDSLRNHVVKNIDSIYVMEGLFVAIEESNFYLKINNITNLKFHLTRYPKYGRLDIFEKNHFENVTSFSTTHILEKKLMYKHDDSENEHDSFEFIATNFIENDNIYESIDFQFIGSMNIFINLQNDNRPYRVNDKSFYTIINSFKKINKYDLCYSDIDKNTKTNELTYFVNNFTNAYFFKKDYIDIKVYNFSQYDIDSDLIYVNHFGPNIGNISFTVSDGSFVVDGILVVIASAPFLKMISSGKIFLENHKNYSISSNDLFFITNLFTDNEHIFYDIITRPNFGEIVLKNIQNDFEITNKFSQKDIIEHRVFYCHKSNNTSVADLIKIRVKCQDISNISTLNVQILPSYYWKPLKIISNLSIYVEELTSVTIKKCNLETFSSFIQPEFIKYYVTEGPKHGYLEFNDFSSINVNYFNQKLINEQKLQYVQYKSNQTSDFLVLNITNDVIWLNNVVFNFIIIPEFFTVLNSTINVIEGQDVTISSKNIHVHTEFYKDKITNFEIIDYPKFGCLYFEGKCNQIRKFLKVDLDNGRFKYVHDNSENLLDKLTLITLAANKRSKIFELKIIVQPVNDQFPYIINKTEIKIREGSTCLITNSILAAGDNDIPNEIIYYKILGIWSGEILNRTTLMKINFFTQNDIEKKEVIFKHISGISGKMLFSISDGVHTSDEFILKIYSQQLDLKLLRNSKLYIFPLQRKLITSDTLLATVSDNENDIIFEIVSKPNLGKLLKLNNITNKLIEATTFTQLDINNSRIFYEHTHPFFDIQYLEVIYFNYRCQSTKKTYHDKFIIEISISSGGFNAFIKIPNIKVDEGGSSNFRLNITNIISFLETYSGVYNPIIFGQIIKIYHGYLRYDKKVMTNILTRDQLESGNLSYHHDHSDTLNDTIIVELNLLTKNISLCNVSIFVTINPINDQPFNIITKEPQIYVIENENFTFSKNNLLIEDNDTRSSEIVYEILTKPSNGDFVLKYKNENVKQFTQHDINTNQLIYRHNEVNETITKFTCRVSDGQFKPEYLTVYIKIEMVHLDVSLGSPLFLKQGSNIAYLSNNNFVIKTNANRNRIFYRLIELPKHGIIYLNDNDKKREFNHDDLMNNSVMYMQNNMLVFNDMFKIFIGIRNVNRNIGKFIDLIIKVSPLLDTNDLILMYNEKKRLSLVNLDATLLAQITNDNPKYEILEKPIFVTFKKIIRISGEKKHISNNNLTIFSHEEIKSGLIYVLAYADTNFHYVIDGKIIFKLSATIFQPAIGELKFRIKSVNSKKTTFISNNKINEKNIKTIKYQDYLMIAGFVLIGSLILIITILTLLKKCHIIFKNDQFKKNQSNNNNSNNNNLGTLLPPAPKSIDEISLIKPDLISKQYFTSLDNLSIPTTSFASQISAPNCRIMNLQRMKKTESFFCDSDISDINFQNINQRFPFDEQLINPYTEKMTSLKDLNTNTTTNVMLRRNQYWV